MADRDRPVEPNPFQRALSAVLFAAMMVAALLFALVLPGCSSLYKHAIDNGGVVDLSTTGLGVYVDPMTGRGAFGFFKARGAAKDGRSVLVDRSEASGPFGTGIVDTLAAGELGPQANEYVARIVESLSARRAATGSASGEATAEIEALIRRVIELSRQASGPSEAEGGAGVPHGAQRSPSD